MKIRQTVLVVGLVAGAAILAPLYGPAVSAQAATQTGDDLDAIQHSVMSAYALVEKNYADQVSSEKAFYQGAIPGMLRTLDPHSNFVDPQEYAEMQRKMRAGYSGVGMEIFRDGNYVVVTRPFAGSPAYRADLRRGDMIVAVDGKDTKGMESADVANLLRGTRGTNVRITVKREGAPDYISVEVTRGDIETTLVDAYWLDESKGIAFLKIDSFEAQNVDRDVEAAMRRLGETKIKGLIFDLRDNPGGLVNVAANVAGRFLKDGQVVVSDHGRAQPEQVFKAKSVAEAQKYPIVMLVNEHSASAAEIVSGAEQDHDRAWVMGATTFGKGLVQGQFPLHEGAALLLTIAHYYTPSGRLIQRDYSHSSFYDYYTHHGDNQQTEDIKATDSGRKVYGGGGITPDEKYPSHVYNIFERRTLSVYNLSFFHFGSTYWSGGVKPSLPPNWEPDNNTVERFRAYLKTTQVPFTDEEFNANLDFIKRELKYELYWRAFDKTTADRARWSEDPEVKKGVESLPKAQSLLQTVQRVLAERGIRG
ncbi:MAG TPA: S41 family peptidase [Verrucomicrobiae bacterium]|nr:S41 family peptidase [Verrucomicrobiae bacterium]